jgi:soluble lytic murein transglycosylase-like protein
MSKNRLRTQGVSPQPCLVAAGVRHLQDLMSRFELPLALAAYNAGEGTIRRYGGVPPFPETQNYVSRILEKAGP